MGKTKNLEEVYNEEVIYRGKGYLDNVKSCVKINNHLHAEVQGTHLYKTKVSLITLEGECTCPYEYNCKHAVAAYLYYKGGKSPNADKFLNYLETLNKNELIELIKTILPKNPELIKKYTFRKETNSKSFINEFISNFSIDRLKDMWENLDCLNFEQLLKILDYVISNENILNEGIGNNWDYSDNYDDEEDPLYDFIYDAKEELIKRINSKEQLIIVLKKGYANEEIADNGEQFSKFKDDIKLHLNKNQYFWFLLNCKNPDLAEVRDNLSKETQDLLITLPCHNLTLSIRLAEYLNNNILRFINACKKKDADNTLKYFSSFTILKKDYRVNPLEIVKILIVKKEIPEEIAKQLFTKQYFEHYTQKDIRFLVNNINDREFILRNTNIRDKFSKLTEVIKRLKELGYDTMQFFRKRELIYRKHWTQIIEILNSARKLFGDEFVADLIIANKEQFITSSTLKYNLKKEGIIIQNIKGELNVEVAKDT